MKIQRKSRAAGSIPFCALLAILSVVCVAAGGEAVLLKSYPQRSRTFFELGSPEVPPGLLTNSVPLPVGGVTAITRASDGAIWLGTTQGLTRVDFAAPEPDRRQYFGGRRYLPDDRVEQLVPDEGGGVWVRTGIGVAHLELKPMTLAEKAELFEQRIRARHDRYGLVADSRLRIAGDIASNELTDDDNDGLWTAMYAAAECFRYAVAKSPAALANARKSVQAVLFLEEVAGRRGFPARSFIRKGDPMPHGGEWHWTEDGQYYWKGDTSSDEIVGHFFIFGIAYDLLPDEALKAGIATTTRRIMNHILDHGYNLVDLDGKPTLWGWWGPEKLAQEPDERALNSLQLLSFLKTASHITGEPRYAAEYVRVARELGYTNLIARVNEFRTELNYSDEELAMLPFYGIFQYEKEPVMLAVYRRAMDEWWKNIQREANPLWTFIRLTGERDARVDLSAAVWTLYRMPLDTIEYTVRNSHRQDIAWVLAPDRHGRREALTLLPPDERPVMKWNANPFVVDGGSGGQSEDDGAAFLLPYWMGRYHGFLVGE